MIKLRLILIPLILVVAIAIAGCGGGSSRVVGSSMNPEEITDRGITGATATQVAINTYDATGFGSLAVGTGQQSQAIFRSQCYVIPSLDDIANFFASLEGEWTGPDSEGWYSATYLDGDSTYLFKVRYIASSREAQFRAEVSGSQTIVAYFEGVQGEDNLWDGSGYVQVVGGVDGASLLHPATVSSTTRVDLTYSDLNVSTHEFGTITMVARNNGVTFAELTAIYVTNSAEIPEGSAGPVHITGWYGTTENPVDRWAALP